MSNANFLHDFCTEAPCGRAIWAPEINQDVRNSLRYENVFFSLMNWYEHTHQHNLLRLETFQLLNVKRRDIFLQPNSYMYYFGNVMVPCETSRSAQQDALIYVAATKKQRCKNTLYFSLNAYISKRVHTCTYLHNKKILR